MAEAVFARLRSRFWLKTGLLILLVALADWLFLDHPIGWTPAFFGIGLLAAVILTQPYIIASRQMKIGSILLIGLILSMIEHLGLLNIMLFGLGLGALATWPRRQSNRPGIIAKDLLQLYILAPFRSAHDIDKLINVQIRRKHRGQSIVKLLSFMIIPAFLSVLFIFFFAKANPLFANLLPEFNIQYLIGFFHPLRIIFWGMIGVLVWCLLRPRISGKHKASRITQAVQFDFWLSRTSVVFSLVLFNVIFAVQNGLDILFLWSGQALPDAMTYAEYAQTGAYTLIFTILLAAGYVLFVFSDQHRKYQSTAARYAVYFWIAQNVFLLISATYRNSLYIDAYSLTYLRLFAFIWMAIIAIGLLLIILRIYLDRNNSWLIKCNIAVVLAVLYASCFINYSSAIAHYNVRHAQEITGQGAALDINYMRQLGTDALPALEWFVKHTEVNKRDKFPNAESLYFISLYQINTLQDNWRQWTWRRSRIASEYKTKADIFALMDTNWTLQKPEGSSDLKLSIGSAFWVSIENECSIATTQINANETDMQFRETEARHKSHNPECTDDTEPVLQLTSYLVDDFASTRHWRIDDDTLILSDEDGEEILRFSKGYIAR